MIRCSGVLARALRVWAPLAVATTLMAGLVYAAVQHDLRSSADDPQVQMAEDAAARLDAGASPQAVIPAQTVDMARSLAPYTIVFDSSGTPLASSVLLDGRGPELPGGVFDSARRSGEDRLTWQPAADVRSAAVVVPYRGGFVLSGRSLRLVEQRETDTELMVAAAWLLALGAAAVAAVASVLLTAGLEAPGR